MRRRQRHETMAVALIALYMGRAHAKDVTQIPLDDGTTVTGELLDVEVGVRARVRLDDGSVRELAWDLLRAVPPMRQPSLARMSAARSAARARVGETRTMEKSDVPPPISTIKTNSSRATDCSYCKAAAIGSN